MRIAIRLAIFCFVSAWLAFMTDRNGFALAHSSTSVYLLFLVAPGCLLIFFHDALSPTIAWILFILANIFYYEAIYHLLLWFRSKRGISADNPTRNGQ